MAIKIHDKECSCLACNTHLLTGFVYSVTYRAEFVSGEKRNLTYSLYASDAVAATEGLKEAIAKRYCSLPAGWEIF